MTAQPGPLTFEEISQRKLRLMVFCDTCRREGEVRAVSQRMHDELRRMWLDEVLKSGRLRCRTCRNPAGKIWVRATSIGGREFTLEGHPTHQFGALANLELHPRHQRGASAA